MADRVSVTNGGRLERATDRTFLGSVTRVSVRPAFEPVRIAARR